ncbi:hypothetical protein NO1_0576 [Candidatus Termititenax aidoneus]|uniref:Uncharacterized protein n=1 Tax=Termititenax aidoneus TaxID=2218524 RepID=A0A388T9T2_TERA1|nr:hypothetical protein NO1_0576 [Candidatus Termititenax aidoneus]
MTYQADFDRIEKQVRQIIDEQSPNGELNVDYVLAHFVEGERMQSYEQGRQDALIDRAEYNAKTIRKVQCKAKIAALEDVLKVMLENPPESATREAPYRYIERMLAELKRE